VVMASTLFSYLLGGAGLSRSQIESPQSWSAMPESVISSFNYTVYAINLFTLLAVFFSAIRGRRAED
jgi:hypothetical protein